MGHISESSSQTVGQRPDPVSDHGAVQQKLAAALAGSQVALGELFENCRNYLLLVANAAVGDGLQAKVAASDVVQDTFLEAQQIIERFQGDSEEELLRWLTRILENKLGNAVKRYAWSAKRDASREIRLEGPHNGVKQGLTLVHSGARPAKRRRQEKWARQNPRQPQPWPMIIGRSDRAADRSGFAVR